MGCLSHAFTQGRKRGGAIDRLESQSTLSALHEHVNLACKIMHVHAPAQPSICACRSCKRTRKVEGLTSNFRLFLQLQLVGAFPRQRFDTRKTGRKDFAMIRWKRSLMILVDEDRWKSVKILFDLIINMWLLLFLQKD